MNWGAIPALLLLACAGCASAPAPLPLALTYRIDAQPGALEVEVEVSGPCPAEWRLGQPIVGELSATTPEGEVRRRLDRRRRVHFPPGARRVRYRYALAERTRTYQSLQAGAGGARSYMLSGSSYLLRPTGLAADTQVRLELRGLEPLLPWALREREGGGHEVELAARDLLAPGHHGFGLRRHSLETPGGSLEVGFVEGDLDVSDEVVLSWLRQAQREVVHCRPSGRAPHPRIQVILIPASGSWEPAPFGRVLWSYPQSVALYVGEHASAPELLDDWTAIHELCHTLHPRVVPRRAWLTEGLATYYQCVARIRSGRESAARMWGAMAWGYEAGSGEANGLNLRDLDRRLRELHCYRAVYWGGAFLMLELDLELRRRSEGRVTLDHVVARVLPKGRITSKDFAAAVDALAESPLWAEVGRPHLEEALMSRAPELLARLGVEGVGRRATLAAGAADEALRRAIEGDQAVSPQAEPGAPR
ncbi:MAG TPA: hypothetical protein DEA08_07980 [Planctomycetes bacterium]|nr:hypothetical protein [Planctomycetota bacterium]